MPWFFVLLALAVVLAAKPVSAEAMVDLGAVAPGVRRDMRYATVDNFLKKAVYPEARCLLRPPVAERLARVQNRLAGAGFGLQVWDCYRPLTVQKQMWALVPDERYVADPAKGSRHNRGAAVDLTLVDSQGQEQEMPTAFDDFSPRAGRDAQAHWSEKARRNYAVLHKAMVAEGFLPLPSEWWHYDAPGWERYAVVDVPLR
ncbi:M15 family metallopeptidase [Gloeobacter morelensis]|uniref:M15 family metallopeptidase n=1 Tax=Gloeobacter morelensis TaxID=2907343 RepID=UPI001E421596|nr:M15 family metallopeptidase [Gloeobacter morelensis]